MIYKKHYVLIKNFYVFLGEHDSNFVCRRCVASGLTQNVSMIHKQRCVQPEITAIKT